MSEVPPPPFAPPPPPGPRNWLAIAGVACGVLGILLTCAQTVTPLPVGLVPAAAALGFGIGAKRAVAAGNANNAGVAKAAVVVGSVALLVVAVVVGFGILAFGLSGYFHILGKG